MLYIIYGDNIERRKKARNEVGLSDVVISPETEDKQVKIAELISAQNLWGDSQIITLDKILEDKEIKDIIYKSLEDIKNSDNYFIVEETKINAAVLTKLSKYATKVFDCSIGELVNSRGNNRVPEKSPFKLCDYIAAKDKKNAWIELMKLYETDIESEPLHGAIWWKLKMGNAVSGPSPALPTMEGVNTSSMRVAPPPCGGRLGGGPRIFDFVMISLRAHNGECDFRNEIEKWILSI